MPTRNMKPAGEITITRACQTCIACPSQWDAWDADGNYYYLRYRHGHGMVGTKPGAGDLITFEGGGPFDGFISLEDFARHAGLKLALERN